ncbi:MAG: polysaccharide biosynthesis C-terminal domain-containing protein, partial [Candidatus Dormiibacterota bacterium]
FALVALVVFAVCVDVFNRGEIAMIPAGFVMMLLASYSNLLRGGLYAVQRLRLEAIAIVAESALLLVAVLAGVATRQGPVYYLWAYALSYGFDCVYFLVVLHWRGIARIRPSLDWRFVGSWARVGLPFALTFIITSIYFQVDQPLVTLFKGHTEAGWYYSGYKVFASVLFLPQTMLSVAFPVLSVMWKEHDERFQWAVERFWKGLLAIGLPTMIGCVALSPAFRFIYQYRPAEPAFQILSIGMLFMFVTNAFIGALNAMERQSSFAWAAFWSMVINVGTNLVAIPLWGYIGSSWTTVITEAALTTIGYFLLRRHLAALPILRLSWRILLAGVVMGLALLPFRGVTGWLVIPVIAGAALVYGVVLLLVRAIDRDEWAFVRGLLPVGRR